MTTGPAPEAASAQTATGTVLPSDLAEEIVREIRSGGEYRSALDPRQPQRLVDLRWAALAAGRMLGRRVQVLMTKAVHDVDAPITARLVAAPVHRRTVPTQRQHGA